MKKFALLLLAMVIAIGMQGAPVKLARTVNHMKIQKEMPAKQKFVKGETARTHHFNNGASRVITDQPEGEAVTYKRTGDCLYAVKGSGISAGSESGTTTIVFAADNKVYIKDILFGTGDYYGSAWVEGTIEDNTITVPLGQSIYWDDSYQADVILVWGQSYLYSTTDGTYVGITEDADVTDAIYIIDPEAKTISLKGCEQPEVPEEWADYSSYYAAGLTCRWTDDDSFGGFVAKNTVFTETDESDLPTVITEAPDGETITYYRSGGYIANSWMGIYNGELDGKVNVVFTADGKAYIQNPMWWHDSYDSWIVGDYDEATGIISVPTGQYLSWNDSYGYGIRVGWGETYVYEDGVDEETGEPNYYMGYNILDKDVIEFKVENDKKLITLLDSKGDINADFPESYEAEGLMSYWSDDESMTAIEFSEVWEVVDVNPAVPADPTADEWYDCGDESGFSKFYFTLPDKDVEGNKLDPEYLSYSIFIDNGNGTELFTFPAEDYTFDLTEDITEVPYSLYSSAVDFKDYFVYMYRTNEGDNPLFTENIGIQVYYTVDGMKNSSSIVWLYGSAKETVNVTGIVVDQDGNALEGATVTFTPEVEADGAPRRAEAEPIVATTGADGSFTAEVAVNTDYNVVVAYDQATAEFAITTEVEDIDLETIVLDIENTGINDLTANKQVASTTYFDMAGRQVREAQNGVFVKSVRYTDGTVITMKVVK